MIESHQHLLNILKDPTSPNMSSWFQQIALELIFNSSLIVNNKIFQIVELEFYVYTENHPDDFCHRADEQKKAGSFYIHKNGKSYKEGNIIGIDITCGSKSRYGGILIRSICDENHNLIEGPGNVLNKMLESFNFQKVKDLGNYLETSKSSLIKICKANFEQSELIWTPRVGLTLKKNFNFRIPYIACDYRAIKYSFPFNKGKHWIISSCLINGLRDSIKKTRVSNIENIQRLLLSGRNKTNPPNLSKNSKRDDFIIYYGYQHRSKDGI